MEMSGQLHAPAASSPGKEAAAKYCNPSETDQCRSQKEIHTFTVINEGVRAVNSEILS